MEYSLASFMFIVLCLLKQQHQVASVCNCSNFSSLESTSGKNLLHPHCSYSECTAPVSRDNGSIPCPPWYSQTEPGKCKCRKTPLLSSLQCNDEGAHQGGLLQLGHFMSYDKSEEKCIIGLCPYCQFKGPNVTKYGYIQLPDNVSELNSYLCQVLNRTGPMCHRCIPGFGPSLTAVKFQCTNCTTNAWYGTLLFLLVEFVPITIFYLLILAFRIHITSAPMTCFIAFSQTVLMHCVYNRTDEKINFIMSVIDSRIVQVVLVVYSAINLEFLHYIVPPFCISNKLHDVHIILLGYLTALYPLCLVCLSWVCVELHDRNFRLFVLLWKPFHRCCVRLRKGWNPKNDLIDVFASFFLLSYSKILYQSLFLIGCGISVSFNESGNPKEILFAKCFDPSLSCNDVGHLKVTIPSLIVLVLFNILPGLLLVLYPIRIFRACLSKCRLDGIAITIFVNKFHGCYRDGLNGGRDMRSLSGLYFLLRLYILIYYLLPFIDIVASPWIYNAFFLVVTSLFLAYNRPYVKEYMNVLDVLMFVNAIIICLLLSLNLSMTCAYVVVGFILLPVLVFMLIFVFKTIFKVHQKFAIWCCRSFWPYGKLSQTAEEVSNQQLIAPVTSVANYGTCD